MPINNRIKPMVIKSVAATAITATTWVPFADSSGLHPVPLPLSLITITNASTVPVFISFDGANQNEYVPVGQTKELNFQTNNILPSHVGELAKNTILYAQGTAGTGNIYFSGYSVYGS